VTRDEGPHLVLRADGGSTIGVGHAMRMIALGEAWIEHGGRATWLFTEAPGSIVERAVAVGISVERLAAAAGTTADATAVLDRIAGHPTGVVVVDGPAFDLAYLEALAPVAPRLMVVDDLAELARYPAALVLNQNAYADRANYPIYGGPRYLLGLRYVLLRTEFRHNTAARVVPVHARRLLVTFGGGDPIGMTTRTINALQHLDRSISAELEVDVVVGAANVEIESIERAAAASPSSISVTKAVADMSDRMARADLAIVSGGTTVWELARMGCPAVVVTTTPAEAHAGQGLERVGLFDALGPAAELDGRHLAAAMARRLIDVDWRSTMARLGPQLVDGRGSERVVAELRLIYDISPSAQS
jgi:UDP-2,4-diacetamido-2,4,6-trideoxy-beta-L-altropyranose hydrolase